MVYLALMTRVPLVDFGRVLNTRLLDLTRTWPDLRLTTVTASAATLPACSQAEEPSLFKDPSPSDLPWLLPVPVARCCCWQVLPVAGCSTQST